MLSEGDGVAIRSRWLTLAYRLAAVLLIGWGLARMIQPFGDSPAWAALLYYTMLSNLLGLIWLALQGVKTAADVVRLGSRGTSTVSARVAAAVAMAITVTMLIYLIVLAPSAFVQDSGYEPFSLSDNLVHIIGPLLVIFDWVLFNPKGRLRRLDPLLWLLAPLAYMAFAYIGSALGLRWGEERYPYFFLDVDANGLGTVVVSLVVIGIAIAAVGYLYLWADRAMARRAAPRAADRPA